MRAEYLWQQRRHQHHHSSHFVEACANAAAQRAMMMTDELMTSRFVRKYLHSTFLTASSDEAFESLILNATVCTPSTTCRWVSHW
jgi:Leu/Phe-tRNA-protein transferase